MNTGIAPMFGYYAPTMEAVLYIPLAIIGAWGIGHLLRVRGAAERIFVGLGVNAAVLVPITPIAPEFVTPSSTTITIIGLLRSVVIVLSALHTRSKPLSGTSRRGSKWWLISNPARLAPSVSIRRLFPGVLAFILTVWLTPSFYLFESHDLLYFGWLPALVSSGSLAVDFAIPMKMGLSNNLSGLTLVPFALPGVSHGFTDFVFFRAVFAFFFIFLILRRIMATTSHNSVGRITAAIGVTLLIWGSEWAYVLLISSFFPAIGLALLALRRAEDSKDANGVFLILALIAVSKAPIIAVSLITLLYLLCSRKWKPDYFVYVLSGAVILGSILTWVTGPRGNAAADSIQFSVLGLGLRDGSLRNGLEWRLYDWAAGFTGLPGWVVDYVGQLARLGLETETPVIWLITSSLTIVWVISKYFVAYGVFRFLSFTGRRWDPDPLDIWAIGAFFSFLFVRNGSESLYLDHQAHGFILLAVPTSIIFLRWLNTVSTKIFDRTTAHKMGVVTLVVLGILSSTTPLFVRQQSESALSLGQAYEAQLVTESMVEGKITHHLPHSRRQVISAINGTRLAYVPNPGAPSQVDSFLVP